MRLTTGLAHELRNPLNSALLQLALLTREESKLSVQAREQLALVRVELRRVSDLVDDYLSVTEPRRIQVSPTRVAEVAKDAIDLVRVSMPGTGDIVQTRIADELLVRADPRRLTQVFVHLLKNSLEAIQGQAQALIEIVADVADDMVAIVVRDNGPGIPPDIHDIAFTPFVSSKASGTGLGLMLVRQLITAHGGEVWLVSSPGDTGVYFTLPAL